MKNLIIILLMGIAFTSCKEEQASTPEIGVVTVINAVTDAGAIKVNPVANKLRAWSNIFLQINYATGGLYYATTGEGNFTMVPTSDTTKILFNKAISLKPKMYTIYLSGTVATLDTMFREEMNYPLILTDVRVPSVEDSVVNVRFVNLSANSPALKVKLATNTTNEVDNLPYKSIGSWRAYPARTASTAYSFQIRDAATDALITTYNFSATATNRFKNVALVIRGGFGTTGATGFGVSAINYF